MRILDWFKNRPAHFDPDQISDKLLKKAIDKAFALTNPRLKLVRAGNERLGPAVRSSLDFLMETLRQLPPFRSLSEDRWSDDPLVRACFVSPEAISQVLSRSSNLKTLFEKYPHIDEACLILGMTVAEKQTLGIALQGEIIQRDVIQTTLGFSEHQVRICGLNESEVRRLLGTQLYEYLLAEALTAISEDRGGRRAIEESSALIRARLRLLRQQGPGLGSVFASAPETLPEQSLLEAQLLENDRQLRAVRQNQPVLDSEMECLCRVLSSPERYIRISNKRFRVNPMNVLLGSDNAGQGAHLDLPLIELTGSTPVRKAFVLASVSRAQIRPVGINFAEASLYL